MKNAFEEQVFGHLSAVEVQINGNPDDLEQCLVDRKKELIAHLNRVVNEYNDNNSYVKENRLDTEVIEMSNQEITQECAKIAERTKLIRSTVNDTNDQIDEISSTIEDLKAAFLAKDKLVEQCDNKYDQLIGMVDQQEALLKETRNKQGESEQVAELERFEKKVALVRKMADANIDLLDRLNEEVITTKQIQNIFEDLNTAYNDLKENEGIIRKIQEDIEKAILEKLQRAKEEQERKLKEAEREVAEFADLFDDVHRCCDGAKGKLDRLKKGL